MNTLLMVDEKLALGQVTTVSGQELRLEVLTARRFGYSCEGIPCER